MPTEDVNNNNPLDLSYLWTLDEEIWKAYNTYEVEALEWNTLSWTQPLICRIEAILLSEGDMKFYHKKLWVFLIAIFFLNFYCHIFFAILFFILHKKYNKTALNIAITSSSKIIVTNEVPLPLKNIVPVILNNECQRTAEIRATVLFDSGATFSWMSLKKAQTLNLTNIMSEKQKDTIQNFSETVTCDTWDLPHIDVKLDEHTKIKVKFTVLKDIHDGVVVIGASEIERYQAFFKFNREEKNISLYLNKNHKKASQYRSGLEYRLKGYTEGDDTHQLKTIIIDTGANITTMNTILYEKNK